MNTCENVPSTIILIIVLFAKNQITRAHEYCIVAVLPDIPVRSPRNVIIFIIRYFLGGWTYSKRCVLNFVIKMTAFEPTSITLFAKLFKYTPRYRQSCWLAALCHSGGLLNIHIVLNIHRVYTWYVRCVHSIYSAAGKRQKSQYWRLPTSMGLGTGAGLVNARL